MTQKEITTDKEMGVLNADLVVLGRISVVPHLTMLGPAAAAGWLLASGGGGSLIRRGCFCQHWFPSCGVHDGDARGARGVR